MVEVRNSTHYNTIKIQTHHSSTIYTISISIHYFIHYYTHLLLSHYTLYLSIPPHHIPTKERKDIRSKTIHHHPLTDNQSKTVNKPCPKNKLHATDAISPQHHEMPALQTATTLQTNDRLKKRGVETTKHKNARHFAKIPHRKLALTTSLLSSTSFPAVLVRSATLSDP